MKGVDTIARIRCEFFVRGKTIKQIARELHIARNTDRKVLRWEPPSSPGSFVECSEILAHGTRGSVSMILSCPIRTCQRALLVGIGVAQVGIHGKALAAHQPFVQAALHHCLEQMVEEINGAREVIGRDVILEPKLIKQALLHHETLADHGLVLLPRMPYQGITISR
jgi:hypothetical protein